MLKKIILGAIGVALSIVVTPNCYACYCVVQDVPQALASAKAVFVGRVAEITLPSNSDKIDANARNLYAIRFNVEKSWKGVATENIDVLSDQGNPDNCFSFPFVSKGEKYLVYATEYSTGFGDTSKWLVINNCSRTALLPDRADSQPTYELFPEFNVKNGRVDLKRLDQIKAGIQPIDIAVPWRRSE